MGHADEHTARQKEEELIRAQVELEERRRAQEHLNAQLREKEEMAAAAAEKYSSVEDEVASKSKKLKKLWSRYEQTKLEVKDIQKEFQQEKEDLLDTIREQVSLSLSLSLSPSLSLSFSLLPPSQGLRFRGTDGVMTFRGADQQTTN